MVVLVTGAAEYVGSNTVRRLGRVRLEGSFSVPTPRLEQSLIPGANDGVMHSLAPENEVVLVQLQRE